MFNVPSGSILVCVQSNPFLIMATTRSASGSVGNCPCKTAVFSLMGKSPIGYAEANGDRIRILLQDSTYHAED